MRFIKPSKIGTEMVETRKESQRLGNEVGWERFKEMYRVLKGTTTYWGGLSSHGKTYVMLNVLRNLSDMYGWKHAIFSPETGNAAEIMLKITQIHAGKPSFGDEMSDKEVYQWSLDLDSYYTVIEMDDDELFLDNFIKAGRELCETEGIDTLTLDPFNELRHRFDKHGGREDKYLEDKLTEIRRMAQQYDIHINIAAHARSDRMNMRGNYSKPPSMYDFSGGEAFANKAMNVLCVYRPLDDGKGNTFPNHNKTEIYIQKVKPDRVGKRGVVELWYDHKSSRFYEETDTFQRKFVEVAKKKAKEPEQAIEDDGGLPI